MASSVGRKRRDTASPSIKDLLHGSPRSLIDALAVLAIGLSVGLFLGFSGEGRKWTIEALGYGWVPVSLFVALLLGTLRYNRRILFAQWRRWTVAAALTAMSIGALSTIFPSGGALEDVSLGGRWGAVLGGTPAILAFLKIVGMALVVPITGPIRWGIPLNGVNSTRFGSTMRMRNCSGVLVSRKDATMELMQTLFPLPVAPAISTWGKAARSKTTGLPPVS